MVAFGPVRRALRGGKPADRGKTGDARGRRAGLTMDDPGMDERTVQTRDSAKAHTSLSSLPSWRTPAVILACGCLIPIVGFVARPGLRFFLTPMSSTLGCGRDLFPLALARLI